MASICNDERGHFGVMSGHERKTLRLSVFIWLVNTFSSVIRSSGNMVVPSATLLLVALLQVLVSGALGLGWGPFPRLGMAGVAAGQLVANALGAAFLLFWLMSGRAKVQLKLRSTPLQWPLARDILRVGAVACLSPLQTVLTILILTRLVAHFGTDALAGYGIGTRLEFLLVPIAFAVGVASVRWWAWPSAPARWRGRAGPRGQPPPWPPACWG